MKKKPAALLRHENPTLVITRKEAESRLVDRINAGKEILSAPISSQTDYENQKPERSKWDAFNIELLKRIFDNEAIAEEYKRAQLWGSVFVNPSLGQSIRSFHEGLQNKITKLESVIERLELFPENADFQTIPEDDKRFNSKNVFIVHGHDEAAKSNVARFLEKLGLRAIILHEQVNKGRTIIEKFEDHATDVGFAVVLLTPDDVGASADDIDRLQTRARQNVILELGYFCGLIGRDRVFVLHHESVEIPSDYLGVVYTPFDARGAWQMLLVKELKEVGLEFDVSRAF